MQLQTSVVGPPTPGHPSVGPMQQAPYHGPPPNVMVQNSPQLPPQVGPPPGMPQGGHPGPHVFGPGPEGHPGIRGPGGVPPGFPMAPAVTLESRIYEMNKRLQHRSEDQSSLWWEAFGNEFFDDEAQLTLKFVLEDGPKRYTIGRTLIPRYFRSMFDGGVKDLYFVLRAPTREWTPMGAPGVLLMECENALMVTRHEKPGPGFTEVYTEGKLVCEFSCEDAYYPRIRHWIMEIRSHQEFVPRGALNINQASDPAVYQDQLSKNITRQGMTSYTLNYLRLCVILEPMQQLMSQHKAFGVPPRECLKNTLFQRFQANSGPQQRAPPPPMAPIPPTIPPEETAARPPAKRKRNRKGSQSGGTTPTGTGGGKKGKNSAVSPAPAPTSFALSSHVDVMVVGEPSLMGGEYGEEDERMISRMENTQYDPANPMAPPTASVSLGGMGVDLIPGSTPFDSVVMGWPHTGGPGSLPPRPGSRTPQTPTSGSRTATPSGTVNTGSPATGGLNGQRTVKTETPDNCRGSSTPTLH